MFSRSLWRMLVFVILAAFLLVYITPVAANDLEQQIQERFGELDSLKDVVGGQKKELKQYKSEEERLLEELKELEISIEQYRRELNKLEEDINATEKEIERVTEELAQAEAQFAKIDEMLRKRLRFIYQNGDVDYLEVLLNASSFSEFITCLNNLKTIAQNDYQLLEQAREEKLAIGNMKADLEDKHNNLVLMRREKIAQKEELDKQVASRKTILEQVQEQIEEQERVIRELEEEAKALEEVIRRLQEEQRRKNNLAPGKLLWPVAGFGRNWITSGYGYRTHPITGQKRSFHGGIDIGIPHNRWPGSSAYNGNPVNAVAAADGVVIFTGISGSLTYGYGRLVIVDHGGGMSTVYAHNHNILVSTGQEVTRGQPLSIIGSTGSSTGPHLHFEVRINGERVNPMQYF